VNVFLYTVEIVGYYLLNSTFRHVGGRCVKGSSLALAGVKVLEDITA
jgi:hypothetical protein